jgi:hypothetical protein
MKVFYNFSARELKKYKRECLAIDELVKKLGHNHTFFPDFSDQAEQHIYSYGEETLQNIYTEAITAMNRSDIILLEVSVHSFTQGFLLNEALSKSKPVIALYHSSTKPAFSLGIISENLQVVEYTIENLPEVLSDAIKFAQEKIDIRFNMFVSPEINTYIKWAAKKNHTQKANFIRSLVLKHKAEHEEEYQEDVGK